MNTDPTTYIVNCCDRWEKDGCCKTVLLDSLPLSKATNKTPYDYGLTDNDIFICWPVISFDEDGNNVYYSWNPFSKIWMRENRKEEDNYQEDWEFLCRICGDEITSCELCSECAKDNDPFFTSKYNDNYRSRGEF